MLWAIKPSLQLHPFIFQTRKLKHNNIARVKKPSESAQEKSETQEGNSPLGTSYKERLLKASLQRWRFFQAPYSYFELPLSSHPKANSSGRQTWNGGDWKGKQATSVKDQTASPNKRGLWEMCHNATMGLWLQPCFRSRLENSLSFCSFTQPKSTQSLNSLVVGKRNPKGSWWEVNNWLLFFFFFSEIMRTKKA